MLFIIIPLYNEEKNIYKNIFTIHDELIRNSIIHKFILIDDGSQDSTWFEIKKIHDEIPGTNAIRFSRNFGKESAICAGLEYASTDSHCDVCIVMDSDLQHPPSLIPQMLHLWKTEGYNVVECVKNARGKENFIHKIGALFFYKVLYAISDVNLSESSDFKLLDSKVVASWKELKEYNTFFRGMSAWVGFKRSKIYFNVDNREQDKSKWSLRRLFKLAVNAITSFSSMPLQLITFLGIIFLMGSVILGVQTLYMKIMGMAFSGFTSVILLLLIIGSSIMISLGIIGTYIARIFEEVKARPRYIVSEKLTGGESVQC